MSETKKHPSIALLCLCIVALIVLLADGVYLLVRHIDLERGTAEYGAGICSIAGGGCDDVLTSAYAEFMGISAGALGTAYGLVVLLLIIGMYGGWGPRKTVGTCLVLFTGLGLAGSLAFIKILFIDMEANCPLCLLYHAANLVMSISAWGIASTWVPLAEKGATAPDDLKVSSVHLIPGLGLPIVVGLFAIAAYFAWHQYDELQRYRADIEKLLSPQDIAIQRFEQIPPFNIPRDDDVPRLGPKDARHSLVVFSDFECPHCARAAAVIQKLHEDYPTQIEIVYRHMPLSSECNAELAAMNYNLHPQSCQAAEAAEAARLQGKFWEYHDLMYSRRSEIESTPFRIWAEELGLDVQAFNQAMGSRAGQENIQRDIALANRLGVNSTPTLYFDGREVRFWSQEKTWDRFMEVKLGGIQSADSAENHETPAETESETPAETQETSADTATETPTPGESS